jgi:hypothetical protein
LSLVIPAQTWGIGPMGLGHDWPGTPRSSDIMKFVLNFIVSDSVLHVHYKKLESM